jgi:hypothetical protein
LRRRYPLQQARSHRTDIPLNTHRVRRIGFHATGRQPSRDFRVAPKIGTIRLKFGVHPENPQ